LILLSDWFPLKLPLHRRARSSFVIGEWRRHSPITKTTPQHNFPMLCQLQHNLCGVNNNNQSDKELTKIEDIEQQLNNNYLGKI
jgi:hypothetical protein